VLDLIVSTMDQSLLPAAAQYQPQALLGTRSRAGRAAHGGVVFVTGALASNILGQRLVLFWKRCWDGSRW